MLEFKKVWVAVAAFSSNEFTEGNFFVVFVGFQYLLRVYLSRLFLLLVIYGEIIQLIASAIILGIGHIGIHLQHLKAIK